MRGVVVCSVGAFAATLAWCGTAQASDEPESNTEAAAHLLFFSGADVWRNGGFLHGGFLYAHQGLSQDGPVFKLLFNGGFYRFHAGGSEITGRQVMAAALPGWRWNRPGFELTVFAGLDAQNHRYTPDDTANRLRGTHVGLRGGFDVWYEPFAGWMLTGSASLSTAGRSYWARAAGGRRFLDAIWLGPEFLACGDDGYRQLRFGAHVTSLRMGGAEWSMGAGWVTDTDRRDGMYGRVGVLVRR